MTPGALSRARSALLEVPGFGRLRLTVHALDRMDERGVTLDALCEQFLAHARTVRAAFHLAPPAPRGAIVNCGDLCLVVSRESATVVRVATVYWRNGSGRVSQDG